MTFVDCLVIFFDVFLLTMFGTALSSVVNFFLNTQGQVSAVGSIVSSMYGFICGAYMPIASFSAGLQDVLLFLPSTYCSSLIRNHTMSGAFAALKDSGVSADVIESIKKGIYCNLCIGDVQVSIGAMYAIIIATTVLMIAAYVLINIFYGKRKSKKFDKKSS